MTTWKTDETLNLELWMGDFPGKWKVEFRHVGLQTADENKTKVHTATWQLVD